MGTDRPTAPPAAPEPDDNPVPRRAPPGEIAAKRLAQEVLDFGGTT